MNLKEQFENRVSEKDRADIMSLFHSFNGMMRELWMVGGAVRDLASGRVPHDFDFATNASIEEMKAHFRRVIPTGEDHGTVTIRIKDSFFEVTRFRKDVATDGRRATVEFAETIEVDLARRDFTMNAIAFDPSNLLPDEGKIVDPFNGLHDLDSGVLKFVGDAKTRILEDHLRALRFVRFLTKMNLMASSDEVNAVMETFDARVLSQERINEELLKIFEALEENGNPHMVELMLNDLDLFPEFAIDDECVIQDMVQSRSLVPLALAVAAEHGLNSVCEKLKLSAGFRMDVQVINLFTNLDFFDEISVKKFMGNVSRLNGSKPVSHLIFRLAWIIRKMGHITEREFLKLIDSVLEIESTGIPFLIKHLVFDGKDMQRLGVEGVEIGFRLNQFLDDVLVNPELNTNKDLLSAWIGENLNFGVEKT